MRTHFQSRNPRVQQRGASLIEVLVAVLILGIGMLGAAAMQATTLRNNLSGLERSQAVIATYSISDVLRANAEQARANNYNLAMACTAPTGTGRIAVEQAAWINAMKSNLSSNACGAISCTNNMCTISVRWDDSRATAGNSEQAVTAVSRI